MKKTILLFAICNLQSAICNFISAQQRMQYSQYMLNGYIVNPAISGIEDYMDIKTGYTHQWTGFVGAPQSNYLSVHTSLGKDNSAKARIGNNVNINSMTDEEKEKMEQANADKKLKHGVGGYLFSERTGPIINNGINLTYAAHFALSEKLKLSAGLAAGAMQYQLGKVKLLNQEDKAFSQEVANTYIPNINAGLMLYSENYFVGISSGQLYQSEIKLNENTNLNKLKMHHFINAGYRIKVNDNFSVMPSVMLRYVSPAPASVDVNLNCMIKNMFTGGISYRHKDAVVAMLGVTLSKKIVIGYSYDFTLSNLSNHSSGSHGIVLGYKLAKKDSPVQQKYFW